MAGNSKFLKTRRASPPLVPMAMIGAGLILFGLAAIVLLPKTGGGSPSKDPAANEVSAVPATVDYPAPDLHLTDLDGRPVSLTGQLGKWVLVNNWATWCPPCKAEMPTLQAYYEDHRDQNFTLIAIDAGEPVGQVAEYVEKNNLHIPVWPDPEQKVYDVFHNISLPASWLIDPQGQVRLAWVGAIDRETLEKYVTPLLEE